MGLIDKFKKSKVGKFLKKSVDNASGKGTGKRLEKMGYEPKRSDAKTGNIVGWEKPSSKTVKKPKSKPKPKPKKWEQNKPNYMKPAQKRPSFMNNKKKEGKDYTSKKRINNYKKMK